MASNTNSGDATKKNKSSTNENNYNNKNFNQKNKSRNHKSTTSDKTTMDSKNGNGSGTSDKTNKNNQCENKSSTSDEDRCWKFRPPPRGFTSESYVVCQSFIENGICNFGNQCVEAHGDDELKEWKERFDYRKTNLERTLKLQYGKTYTEEVLERLQQASNPEKIMKEKLAGVDVYYSNELNLTVSSKTCKREWIFVFKTVKKLKAVALLQDEHRTHFSIRQVFLGKSSKKSIDDKQVPPPQSQPASLTTDQEWLVNLDADKKSDDYLDGETLVHRVKIGFSTDIYGTFRQAVCFEFFGSEALLVKHFCIDVVPVDEYDKIQEIKNDILTVTRTRWNSANANLVPYKSAQTYSVHNATATQDTERETELMDRYPCPQADTFVLSQSTISGKLSDGNYQQWMHTLLYIEEIARFDLIAKFNLTTNLKITNNFILSPNGMATSTAKYSHSGELFGVLELFQNISEETPPGYLILNNCNSLYFTKQEKKSESKPDVYEALIEDKSKNVIYLKLSADTVKSLSLKHDDQVKVDIQFQPNRLTYCEWHMAIDKIADYKILFPDISDPDIPWNPSRQFDSSLEKLNSKQKEAVVTITSPINIPLPPILLIGPFGTGKTFTLAQIIKQLLNQSDARILICTHSNSAADLYIREYLHPWVEEGIKDAKPLRVYYHKRWVATVNSIVQKYCLIETKTNTRVFKRPTVEDVYKHKIVVVTLSTSMELASLNLKKGYFTHILLDEAAQALECEAIMPLALADTNTRIVLAGDHMQMSPEIFSNFARERKLHVSLLERLYDYYPATFPTKILLCENYRAHEAIIKFTSELFYDQKLIASGKQPRHEKFYPLTFFTTRGEDIQDKNSTAFYNNAEVYEIVERVCELRRKWPASWGKFNDQSIGIMTPYADQVFRIRSELRKKRMAGISVERVLNVQGKQFRAVFLSTVRTRKTCTNKTEDIDYGFLSNSKLLNTAITRAQSLVSVVGDPVALCSIGRCRKVWERFIEICHLNKSLFGITWQTLKSQLDGVEMRKNYILNPLAPEFIPRAHQTESYLRDQIMMNNRKYGPMMMQPHTQITPGHHNHPMNFHHSQQQAPMAHPSFHPHMQQGIPPPSQQQNHMMGPHNGPFPSLPPTGPPQGFNNNLMTQQFRPPYHPMGPMPPPQPPQNNAQQFPPFNSNGVFNNFNQPSAMPHAQSHPPIMPNFHMNQHLNTNNLWSSPNSIYASGIDKTPSGGNPWPMKLPALSQQSPHQIRPPIASQVPPLRPPMGPQHGQMFTPPPQFHHQQQPQQQPMSSFQSLPKFPPGSIGDMSPFNGVHGTMDLSAMSNQTSKLTLNELMSQPDLMESLKKSEKDIQFLHNVHFPEQKHQFAMNAIAQQQSSKLETQNINASGNAHLLPPNMTFLDVANESREFQFRWFMKLSEMYGLGQADKFAEILRELTSILSNNGNKVSASNHACTMINGIDPAKNYMHLMESKSEGKINQMLKPGMNDNIANKLFQSDELDSIFINSIQNQKFENDLLSTMAKDNDSKSKASSSTMFQQQQQPPSTSSSSNFADRNILNGIDLFNLSSSKPIDLESSVQSPQRSVPLYMRRSAAPQNKNFE